jgi:membrane protease YdiL (CAAX protease family)
VPEGAPASSVPRWAPWTSVVALLAGLAGAIFGAILIGVVAAALGSSIDDSPPGVEIGATFFQDASLIVSALLFARLARRPRPEDFGLRPVRLWTAAKGIVIGWVTFYVFSAIWVAALSLHEKDDLPKELGADKSSVALAAVAVLVCVVAPIAEEFFFRGYFFTALRNWRGPWPAAILTGIVFGGIHAGSAPAGFLVPLMFLGFVLCILYWRLGSLLPCIGLHCLNNSLALGVSQGWDWQVPVLMVGSNLFILALLTPVLRSRRAVLA